MVFGVFVPLTNIYNILMPYNQMIAKL
uniref:Uncharacterized protein n=1 Tax=Rhizophora mucronata TaxID=61149 RepID=A0A2P2QTB7_RHIMU